MRTEPIAKEEHPRTTQQLLNQSSFLIHWSAPISGEGHPIRRKGPSPVELLMVRFWSHGWLSWAEQSL